MYDQDRDGYISKQEMKKIFNELYKMMGDVVSLQDDDHDTPRKLMNKIFIEANTFRIDLMSFEEFKQASLRDPLLNPLKL